MTRGPDAGAADTTTTGAGSGWKPYAIAFVLGAVVLTVMPLVSRQFLKAPPPIKQLSPWEAAPLSGQPVSSQALQGTVVLATWEGQPCEAECLARQQRFGDAQRHVDDLKGTRVQLVTFVDDAAKEGLAPLAATAPATWRFATPPAALGEELQGALDAFLHDSSTLWPRSNAIALIDQNGAVRGFWRDEPTGHGNAINAARLLAKYGPAP